MNRYSFYEFFAGGGMARLGLGPDWHCAFANDFDPVKARSYRENWHGNALHVADVGTLNAQDVPGVADLAWASFPCQDLSLAGLAAGIGTDDEKTRSGAFWSFWRLMRALQDEGRAPAVIVLENVYGCLTVNQGRDFACIVRELVLRGYRVGGMIVDAVDFVPQSRSRLFIFAFGPDVILPPSLLAKKPNLDWHPDAMVRAMQRLSDVDQQAWLWLAPTAPDRPICTLKSILENEPGDVPWHSASETRGLLDKMAPASLARLAEMCSSPDRQIGTIFKRTRLDEAGIKRQRAELRFDGIAGCLRTPGGGSSRQIVIVVEKSKVRTRLLSAREGARLMGLPDSYVLPARYNDACHLIGDGLVVPVVRFLAERIIEPCIDGRMLAAAA